MSYFSTRPDPLCYLKSSILCSGLVADMPLSYVRLTRKLCYSTHPCWAIDRRVRVNEAHGSPRTLSERDSIIGDHGLLPVNICGIVPVVYILAETSRSTRGSPSVVSGDQELPDELHAGCRQTQAVLDRASFPTLRDWFQFPCRLIFLVRSQDR